MGTKQHAIRLALLQVAVIVFSVLASAACLRLDETSVLPGTPTVTIFMTQRGYLLLLVPLAWTWLMVRRRPRGAADSGRPGVFFLGIVLFLALCLLAVESIVQPWRLLNTAGSVLAPPPQQQ